MMDLLGVNPIGLSSLLSLVVGSHEFSVDAPANWDGSVQGPYPAPQKAFVGHRLSLWDGSRADQEQGETGRQKLL
jgi:hypothetical protein